MFSDLKNMKDLAVYLGVNYFDLNKVLFSHSNYTDFEIQKKHGGIRKISAPKKIIKQIQAILKMKFESEYEPKYCVNGFIKNKSIYTNALPHVKKQFLLNIDLLDFFPSINFNRVKSLLEKQPFNANENISRMIANLITHNGLPQGASTSPIISNMICRRLDNRLFKYCNKYNADYSRYADDITISWDNGSNNKYYYNEHLKKINDVVVQIITEEGFVVNDKKTFFSSKNGHKEVTGIMVNKFTNIPKDYFYRLRSIINDAHKNGFEMAYQHHCDKKNIEFDANNTNDFIKKVMGMMSYYSMVVNNDSFSRKRFILIAKKLNCLLNYDFCKIKYSIEELKKHGVYILEKHDGDDISYGTIFRYKKYMITCKHCLMNDDEFSELASTNPLEVSNYLKIYKYKYSDGINSYDLNKLYVSPNNDLAIFLEDNYLDKVYFSSLKTNSTQGESIKVMGYPDYKWLDGCSVLPGTITSTRVIAAGGVGLDRNDYFVVDASIVCGNSGGPVVDEFCNVIGIATWGVEPCNAQYAKVQNGVLKAKYINEELDYIEQNNFFQNLSED